MASENPEFGTTLARRLNQSRASAVLQSNLIAIKSQSCLDPHIHFYSRKSQAPSTRKKSRENHKLLAGE